MNSQETKEQKLKKHEQGIIETIKKYKLMRFNHIFGKYTGISRAGAYDYGLDKLDTIKDLLAKNRQDGVNYLLQKWITSDNATLQIASMRLICDSEDHRRLNQQYQEITGKDGKDLSINDDKTLLTCIKAVEAIKEDMLEEKQKEQEDNNNA